MRLISKFKKQTEANFIGAARDIIHLSGRIDNWARQHRGLTFEFNQLRDEIATNGVVRDLRKLEKAHAQLEAKYQGLENFIMDKFAQLETNGVATAINKLNDEVFSDRKTTDRSIFERVSLSMAGVQPEDDQQPTLRGTVEAIVEHLGLDVNVSPEEVKEAKVVAKRKPAAKKKGRR